MNENIIWALFGDIREGKDEEFKIIMNEMIAAVSKEEGTINYEWTLGEDNKSLHVYERYKNANAARAHLLTWNQFASRFMNVVEIKNIVVYSDLPEDLKAGFYGATFMKPIGGFVR